MISTHPHIQQAVIRAGDVREAGVSACLMTDLCGHCMKREGVGLRLGLWKEVHVSRISC